MDINFHMYRYPPPKKNDVYTLLTYVMVMRINLFGVSCILLLLVSLD